MNQHVFTSFLKPLSAVYGEPGKPEHVEGFFREYARLLGSYRVAELEAARDRLLGSYQPSPGRRWPSIPDCVSACEDARGAAQQLARLGGSTKLLGERERQRREMEEANTLEAFMIADQLVQSSLGRLAASQGWILGLHDWCRRHRQLPDPVKDSGAIVGMKANAKYFDQTFDACSAALQHTARIMRAKREKLRAAVLKEDGPC